MKKRVISLLLALVLALGLLPTTAWAAGTDAVDVPIEISSEEELKDFRTRVNNGEKSLCAKLTADITLTDEWEPISNVAFPADAFAGTFDGNGHMPR